MQKSRAGLGGVSRRLYYSCTDLIVDLPGPDESGNLRKLAAALGGVRNATVEQLYKHKKFSPKCAPEFVAMVLCLEHGQTFSRAKAQQWLSKTQKFSGPCTACKAASKGISYCRQKQGHAAPSAPSLQRGRKRKRE
jgi:hypothetical protein